MTTFRPKLWTTLGVAAVLGAGTAGCAHDGYGYGSGEWGGGWYGERGERGERGEGGERGERGD